MDLVHRAAPRSGFSDRGMLRMAPCDRISQMRDMCRPVISGFQAGSEMICKIPKINRGIDSNEYQFSCGFLIEHFQKMLCRRARLYSLLDNSLRGEAGDSTPA